MDYITQDYLDGLVLWVADKKTDLAGIVCDHIANSDPAKDELMIKLMAISVLHSSIRNYNITWDALSSDDIMLIEELISSFLQTCPNY